MYFTPMPKLELLLDLYEDIPHSNLNNVCFDRKSKFEGKKKCKVEPQRSIKTHLGTPRRSKMSA